MEDVRRELWKAYKQAQSEGWLEGKSSEAWCELEYPTFWDCETEEDFLQPCGIMIYSYALGPSRTHYINRGPKDKKVNYYTWESPDIFAKAIEVIQSWVAK